MSLLQWRDAFAIGVPGVDHEHQRLIALINEAHAELERDDAGDRVADTLGEIHARVAAHFALEEGVMRDRGDPQYPGHKADHERLLDDIRDIMDDFEDRHEYDPDAFSARLASWFTEHFQTWDTLLHARAGS